MSELDWGSVPDWLQAIGGVGAVAAALIVAGFEARRANAAERGREADRLRPRNELGEAIVETGHMALDALGEAREAIRAGEPWMIPSFNPIDPNAQAPRALVTISRKLAERLAEAAHALDFFSEMPTTDLPISVAARRMQSHLVGWPDGWASNWATTDDALASMTRRIDGVAEQVAAIRDRISRAA